MAHLASHPACPHSLPAAATTARLAVLLLFFLVLGAALPPAVAADTQVTGDIAADTTWTMAGSAYIVVGNVRVLPGVTLTIRPGVQVKLDPTQSLVVDGGSLRAEGTPDSVIVFKRNQAGRWGMIVGYEADLTFRHCRVEWSSSVPINYNGEHHGMISNAIGSTVIEDCVLSDAGRDATDFQGGSAVFRRNVVFRTYRQAFDSWDDCATTVEDCRVVDCNDDAYSITGVATHNLVFRNNVVIGSNDDGLDIDYFYRPTRVTGFEAYDCNDKGVSVSRFSESVVIENAVVNGATEGFTATDGSVLSLFNCVAYDCTRAFAAYEKNPFGGGADLRVASSIAWNSGTPVHLDSLSTAIIFYSILDTPEPYPGAGNQNADPRFVNPENFLFALAPDSPAIDAGWSDAMPEFDLLGHPRVDVPWVPNTGGGPFRYYDIGAYEYQAITTPVGESAPAASRYELRAAPVPASGPVTIAFDLPAAGEVEVQIFDAAGRAVGRLHQGSLAAGHHELSWQVPDRISLGVYFVRLTAGGEEATAKIVLAR